MGISISEHPVVNTGERYSRLTIVGPPFGVRLGSSRKIKSYVVAECDCGAAVVLPSHAVRNGNTKSCGCAKKTQGGMAGHGKNRDPLYTVWCSMRQRCSDENGAGYKNYGGRGICVCYEWLDSFAAFKEWAIFNGWTKRMHVDRSDNDGPYAPWNCRVVPAKTNHRNKRSNTVIFAWGESKPLAGWLEDPRCLASGSVVSGRIKRGWSSEMAISTPPNKMGGRRVRGCSLEPFFAVMR